MIKPTSKNINLISIIITIIVFIAINGLCNFYNKNKIKISLDTPQITKEEKSEPVQNIIENEVPANNTENDKSNMAEITGDWIIEIPEINLRATIAETTTKDVMDKYVGHFEDTKLEYGNVGLAAHNRGYQVNYFQNLKKLKEGSKIIYKHKDFEMTYLVETIEIIEDTNWEYLKNTEDNRITLITCVENEPKYRRCIQGVEEIESEEY